jgi:predicted GNAT family acetyltransferase
MTTEVTDNPSSSRFELTIDDELVGYMEYQVDDGEYTIPHTQILPKFRHRGLGATLVVGSLETIRDRQGRVLPYCSFVPKVMRAHPELAELVPESERASFGV